MNHHQDDAWLHCFNPEIQQYSMRTVLVSQGIQEDCVHWLGQGKDNWPWLTTFQKARSESGEYYASNLLCFQTHQRRSLENRIKFCFTWTMYPPHTRPQSRRPQWAHEALNYSPSSLFTRLPLIWGTCRRSLWEEVFFIVMRWLQQSKGRWTSRARPSTRWAVKLRLHWPKRINVKWDYIEIQTMAESNSWSFLCQAIVRKCMPHATRETLPN